MTIQFAGHKSVAEVARLSNGYPELVRCLCARYLIPVVRNGRYSWIADEHVNEVIWRVDEWKHRPRLSRPGAIPRKAPSTILSALGLRPTA